MTERRRYSFSNKIYSAYASVDLLALIAVVADLIDLFKIAAEGNTIAVIIYLTFAVC